MAMKQKRYDIVGAPSKWDLMLALFDSTIGHPRTVNFTIRLSDGSVAQGKVRINGVSQEDGSGDSWLFRGIDVSDDEHQIDVRGWFKISDRHGWIEFLD